MIDLIGRVLLQNIYRVATISSIMMWMIYTTVDIFLNQVTNPSKKLHRTFRGSTLSHTYVTTKNMQKIQLDRIIQLKKQVKVDENKTFAKTRHNPSSILSFFFWSGLQCPKAYSLWGGVVPSPSIG